MCRCWLCKGRPKTESRACRRKNDESEIDDQLEEMIPLPGFDEPLSECPCCEPERKEIKDQRR
jgi:hypothetical protein